MSTSLEDPRLTEHVTLPTGEKSTLSFKHSHTGLSCVLTKFSPTFSDSCTDGTMASSSNDSHYSGSRVETPVSYMGDDDDEDEYDENDDED